MRTFIAGLVGALVITAVGWLGLEAAQISRVEVTSGQTDVRLGSPDHSDARPVEER